MLLPLPVEEITDSLLIGYLSDQPFNAALLDHIEQSRSSSWQKVYGVETIRKGANRPNDITIHQCLDTGIGKVRGPQ